MLASPLVALKGLLFLLVVAGGIYLLAGWMKRRLMRDFDEARTEAEQKSIMLTSGVLIFGTIALEAIIFAIALNVIFQ